MSLRDNGANLFVAELLCAGRVSAREHAARSADLNQICPVLHNLARLLNDCGHAVGNSICPGMIFGREQIFVAVPARYAYQRAGDLHARPLYVASIDGITQCNVRVARRSHIAHGRKARIKSHARILCTVERCARNRDAQ